jgi:hypothetical protein
MPTSRSRTTQVTTTNNGRRGSRGRDYGAASRRAFPPDNAQNAPSHGRLKKHPKNAVPMARTAWDKLNPAGIERPKTADGARVPIPHTADTVCFSKEAVEGL